MLRNMGKRAGGHITFLPGVILGGILLLFFPPIDGDCVLSKGDNKLVQAINFAELLYQNILIHRDFARTQALFDFRQVAYQLADEGFLDTPSEDAAAERFQAIFRELVSGSTKGAPPREVAQLNETMTSHFVPEPNDLKSIILKLNERNPNRKWLRNKLFRVTLLSKQERPEWMRDSSGDIFLVLTNYKNRTGLYDPVTLMVNCQSGVWKAVYLGFWND